MMHAPSAVLLGGFLVTVVAAPRHSVRNASSHSPIRIATNDNRRPAGALRNAKLDLKLDVVNAQWFPEDDAGPSITRQTFAEQGRAPEIPGPTIRVAEGTMIQVTVHNLL